MTGAAGASGGARANCFNWTDENTAEAIRLRESGLSFRDVAAEIGCPSRNAVIGRLKRAGFVAANINRVAMQRLVKAKPRRTDKGNKNSATRIRAKINGHDPGFVESSPVTDLAIPEFQRKTLMELQHHHCRWPVGDPGTSDFFFCGGNKEGEGPYCAHHARRAVAA